MPVLLACVWGAAGCVGSGGSTDVLDDSTYVEVMSHLASLRWRFTSRDSPAADSARAAILSEWGVGLEELQRYAEEHFADTERMNAIWLIIAERADELDSEGREDREEEPGAQEPDSLATGRP